VSFRITALEFARYRGFRDPQCASLARLTLLYGENNAGKSAFVRVLPLLAGSRVQGRPGLNLDTPVFRGAGFLDVKWRGALPAEDDKDLVLGLRLSDGTTWRWTCEWLDTKSTAALRMLEVHGDGRGETFELVPLGNLTAKDAEYTTSTGTKRIRLDGLIPRESVGALTDERRAALISALDGVIWLGALRKGPPREGTPRGTQGNLAGDGEGAAALVLADKALRLQVSTWFRNHATFHVEAESLGPDLERLVLRPTDPGHNVPFPDAGEGLQQAFPVITALEHLRQQGGTLCVEEPESHLHPRLQKALAEHVVSVLVDQPNANVVFETHSEVFLLAALAAATKPLAGAVGLFWTEVASDGAGKVEVIPIDEAGRPTTPRLEQAFSTMGVMRRQLLADRKALLDG
jgi:hypothetical protein